MDAEAKKNVSILIPVFNEGETAARVIKEIKGSFGEYAGRSEIIVINDGSTDETSLILQKIAGIRVVEHKRNQGYGAALKTGLRNSGEEFVGIIDADGSYSGADLIKLAEKLNGCDMAVGARLGKDVPLDISRAMVRWILRRIASHVFNAEIQDLNSGLRVFKRSLAEKYLEQLPDGFSFTSTITLLMIADGCRIEYVPIKYRRRSGKSKFRPVQDTLNSFNLILKTSRHLRKR